MKENFQKLLLKYNSPYYLDSDPILLIHKYKDPLDIEVTGLIVALYSYGKVSSILQFLNKLLKILGKSPYQTLLNTNQLKKKLQDLPKNSLGPYRFQTEVDHKNFLVALSNLIQLRKNKTPLFEEDFLFFNGKPYSTLELKEGKGIQNFQKLLLQFLPNSITPGLHFLIGKPKSNSPKKRYSMYLRWMVGSIYPDFHLYKNYPLESLVFPLDTHIQKMMKVLGYKVQSYPNRKKIIQFTDTLTNILGEPAINYDFALSRIGILEKCQANYIKTICNQCLLQDICIFYHNNFKNL